MVFFNWATMQMAAKIVYYGPGLCGKTTNLSFIYAKTAPGSRGEMVSLETETDRTLFFDLLPLEVGKVGGFRTRLQLYTVPGQVFYNTTRKLVLKGVDGVVFVADSQRPMFDANLESFRNLEENLRELGLEVANLPLVLQYNKRDLKNLTPVKELNQALNARGQWEFYEAVAVQGLGVFETLKGITKLTLKSLRRRMVAQEGAAVAPTAPPPAARSRVAFNPAALSAAAEAGLEVPSPPPPLKPVVEILPPASSQAQVATAQAPPFQAAEVSPEAETAPTVAAKVEVLPPVEEVEPALEAAPEAVEAAEAEEAPVEFATTAEAAPAPVEAEVRHVKVSSSLDILAELENLRKAATSRPAPQRAEPARPPSFDLDSLLQSSLNSRQEVRRRVEEDVGEALRQASRCLVRIELVDQRGKTISQVSPVEVELERGDRVRQLALTLTVHLRGK